MNGESSPRSAAENRLAHSSSSYLRSARHQPVDWLPWSAEAFARAQAEDKPILLDIGAVWCHWCHVMDRESYEDPEVAALINRLFIAVKVDRDERPDVDARYQAAVSAISGQGGWPLTAFLAPDGRPYFGGTYIPREDAYGRPGILHVLQAMAQVWRERSEEALETAGSVMAAIEQNENFSSHGSGVSLELAETIAGGILARFDAKNGGFGSRPKFAHPAALDLILQTAMNCGDEKASEVFQTTLEKMARGGICDQLAGGFHRYSVDEHWLVPHFEKMLYDNTELLRNYVHGYQSFVREDFLATAREIVGWLDGTMSDRVRGGFYASQDADVGFDDDGDYFTWTLGEARAALDDEEFVFAAEYWSIAAQGQMHHNPAKNVLHVERALEAMEGDALRLRDRARAKLLAARRLRKEPFIDRTLYTGWNAMAVRAYLETARVLRMDSARDFALKTLDRLLGEAWEDGENLRHVIAYPEGGNASVPGTLEDYALTIHACLEAWLASGKIYYYRAAERLADAMIARFYDRTSGAFFDTVQSADSIGVLQARRKPFQDAPVPAGNPVAADALLRLESLNGRKEFRAIAEDTLESFAGVAMHFGLAMGSYALAVERLLNDPVQVVVVGEGAEAARLEATAVARYGASKTVMRFAPAQLKADELPEMLAETLLAVPVAQDGAAYALVCKGRVCLPPVHSAEALLEALA